MSPKEPEAARLYDSFGASLYRYALMILANREAAEDVIQQVFVAMLDRRATRIDDEEHYLRRAVRNGCYSALRHQKVRQTTLGDNALLEPIAAQSAGISEEDRLTLAAAIRLLPADQREVLHLHVFEGRTFKDVAEVTGRIPQHRSQPLSVRARQTESDDDRVDVMTDNELDELLRGVRPAAPRPELRARIVSAGSPGRAKRVWPWALAAAAMLVLTVALQLSTARLNRDIARVVAPFNADADDLAELRAALDADERLMRQAELWTLEARRNAPRAETDSR